MAVFTEINYIKNTETGRISILCNESYNFILNANGRMPRKKDVINAIELLYKELDDKGHNKLETFVIEIKSKISQSKKRKWLKNRKDVFGISKHTKSVEKNYDNLFKKQL